MYLATNYQCRIYQLTEQTHRLRNHNLEIVILFDEDKNINYDAFTFEYSQIYKKIVDLNKNRQIFFYNKVYLSSDFIDDYSYISTLLDKDILILTNVLLI